jgi:DNA repair protein RecN (Recombination protein N)
VIEEISIRDLGVIGEARLPLGPGFTALTGETGAGKTMIVTALGLLRGERADSAAVRSGRPQASVEGSWRVPGTGPVADRVAEAGGELEPLPDGTAVLLLGRTLSSEGRGRALVGGRTAPVGVLAELGERLVAVHGQSDQVRLRSATAQREALDRFGGPQLARLVAEYAEVYRRWQAKQTELDTLVESRERRLAEADSLRAALADIEAADPQRGEDTELAERAERLSNLEDLRLAAAQAQELISSQSLDDVPDVTALLESARRSLDRASAHDPELVPIVEAITAASFAVAEISGSLASYLGGLDTDGARELEGVQERRADLGALIRKYGPTLDDVLDFLDRGSARLLELDTDSDRIESLTAEVEGDGSAVRELADRLSALRRSAAAELGERVTAELAALAMPNARLTVEVTEREELSASGRDSVGILLQPHSGSDPRPIGRGASGGELSRVMLAIEVVLAGSDPVPTFIFDEVDAGVGGASATEIGRRLARLAETAQVIVVTHLAQVAAFATNHLRVVKDAEGAVTESSVQQLTGEARVAEMARLLSGLPDSESGLAHARELLDAARAAVKVGR